MNSTFICSACLIVSIASTGAQAQDTNQQPIGAYLLASVNDINDRDDSDLSITGSLGIGYQFASHWGVELGYRRSFETDDLVIEGAQALLRGSYPLNRFVSIVGKAGIYHWDGDLKYQCDGACDFDGTGSLLGLGVATKISDQLSLIAEWEHSNDVFISSDFDSDFALGLRFNF